MPKSSHLLTRLLVVSALALLPAACSDDSGDAGVTAVQEQLEAQDRAQTALRQRIEELEDRLEALLVADDGTEADQLTDLDDRIALLESGMESLATRLDGAVAAQQETAGAVDELDAALPSIRSSVDELTNQIQALREELDSLRRQFNDHRQHS